MIFCILSGSLLKAQVVFTPKGGQLVAITGKLNEWSTQKNNKGIQVNTRDSKGLIQKQDLPPVPITRYSKKPASEDTSWQKNLRKPVIPFTNNQITVEENQSSEHKVSANDSKQVIIPGMNFSQINPADPSVAVGPSHIIQMINGTNGSALFTISDKQGQTLVGPAYLDQLPGASHNGGGDGVTWYDQFSNRFVMTEFADSSASGISMNTLIVAVSSSDNPLDSWYIYEFFADGYFPDYPKYGNYPDAWFAVTRDFKNTYEGTTIWALDKQAMLTGQTSIPILQVRFIDKDNRYNSMTPVTMLGKQLRSKTNQGYFVYFSDNELTADENDKDSIALLSFAVNFNSPTLSSLKFEKGFEVAPFSSVVCESRNCATSPDGQGYDVVSNKIMHKPSMRDFDQYSSLVLNHTVDANGSGLAGIRWYELRKESEWSLRQQGTFAPQKPGICLPEQYRHRFLGSIMQNGKGQIALGYNFSSKGDYASLAFTGRQENDPLNKFTHEETILKLGSGYGTAAFRWGDYNDIAADPENDSIFWFTGMTGVGSSSWTTTIASFQINPRPALDVKLNAILSPSPCEQICNNQLAPVISVSNAGRLNVTNLLFKYKINDDVIKSWNWTGLLEFDQDITIQIPSFSLPYGENNITIWFELPDGTKDNNSTNDTIRQLIKIYPPQSLPFFEGGESESIPVPWKNYTTGSTNLFWRKTTNAAFEGSRSFLFDNFNHNESGQYGVLETPVFTGINADSLELNFMLAAAVYDDQKIDTLEIVINSGCGQQQTTVFKKWGSALSTVDQQKSIAFIPLQNEWRKETISLNAFRDQSFSIQFKAINNFGNNIYLDAIQLLTYNLPANDLSATAIYLPDDANCTATIQPGLVVTNTGRNNVQAATIELWEGNTLRERVNWTGNLVRTFSDTVYFKILPTQPFMKLSAIVKTVNGAADQRIENDTATFIYKKIQTVNLPFSEEFDQAESLDQWNLRGDEWVEWKKTNNGFKSAAGISANNFGKPTGNAMIISPKVVLQQADSLWLTFRLAAGHRPELIPDTMKIALSVDCGKTWNNIWIRISSEPGSTVTKSSFLPNLDSDWQQIKLNLTPFTFGKKEMLVRLTNISSGNNTVFIDQFNLFATNVAADLREKGFKMLPNPVTDKLNILFYPYATGLESIKLTDSNGRIIFSNSYENKNIQHQIIDCSKISAGVYFVTLQYRDKLITEKIIKLSR